MAWLTASCVFHNTLVDRIVPGYPKERTEDYLEQLAYEDRLLVTAEPFYLWAITETDEKSALREFLKCGYDIKLVPDLGPYRTRKVRILNGAHTAMVALGLLHHVRTVREPWPMLF